MYGHPTLILNTSPNERKLLLSLFGLFLYGFPLYESFILYMLLNLFRCLGDSTYTRCQCTLYGWQYKDIELLCTSIKGLEAHIEKTEESLKWLFVCVCAFGYLMELFIMLNLYIEFSQIVNIGIGRFQCQEIGQALINIWQVYIGFHVDKFVVL